MTKAQKLKLKKKYEFVALDTMLKLVKSKETLSADDFYFKMEGLGVPKEYIGRNSARMFKFAKARNMIKSSGQYKLSQRQGNGSAPLILWICLKNEARQFAT